MFPNRQRASALTVQSLELDLRNRTEPADPTWSSSGSATLLACSACHRPRGVGHGRGCYFDRVDRSVQ